MSTNTLESFPALVTVNELVTSRYEDGERPFDWDQRVGGLDQIRTNDGRTLTLFSDGGQSPPKPGWVLVIGSGDSQSGYRWTLYGIEP